MSVVVIWLGKGGVTVTCMQSFSISISFRYFLVGGLFSYLFIVHCFLFWCAPALDNFRWLGLYYLLLFIRFLLYVERSTPLVKSQHRFSESVFAGLSLLHSLCVAPCCRESGRGLQSPL